MPYLLIAACLPSIVLIIYIYKKDKADKEPFWLLFTLFLLGAFACVPSIFLENFAEKLNFFSEGSVMYRLFDNFIGVALIEEGMKFIALFLITHKSKHFNSLFDGVIYAVITSLGFATLENILYVMLDGYETAVIRAVTAVPGHMFDGVIMGYFYTTWHLGKMLDKTEKAYLQNGYIKAIKADKNSFDYKLQLFYALLIPTLAHGFYDFLADSDSVLSFVTFFIFLILLYVHCFRKVKAVSRSDQMEGTLINKILFERYPELQLAAGRGQAHSQNDFLPPPAPKQKEYSDFNV